MSTPVLHVLAGPNGSGKSTFAELVLLPAVHLPFVNADLMAEELWPGDRDAQQREAAHVSAKAADHRLELMQRRVSFVTETVFSHPSKLELLTTALRSGYLVWLYVMLVPEDLAVARVDDRRLAGGHLVPQDKVRARYQRLWPLVAQARGLCDRTTCYDNASLATPFRKVAAYERGALVGSAQWPHWTPSALR